MKEKGTNKYIRALIKRLKDKCMALEVIPPFVGSLARAISVCPRTDLEEVNKFLLSRGWAGFEMDEERGGGEYHVSKKLDEHKGYHRQC